MTTDLQTPAPQRGSLFIIFLVVFIDLLGFGIVLPLLPRYAHAFQARSWVLGLLMASFSAMQFLFAPLWGRLSDRIGRRPVLLVGLAGSTICYGLFGWATSLGATGTAFGLGVIPWLFITRIGAGIAGATIPTAQAYIADCTGAKERGRGMALIGAAFGLGFTFGPLLALAVVSGDPKAAPSAGVGYLASALSGAAFLAAIFLLKESLRPDSRPAGSHWLDIASLSSALRRPQIGLILMTMALTTFAFSQFESTLSLLTQHLGMSDRGNFAIFAYLGLTMSLAQGYLVRKFLPKLGETRMAKWGAWSMIVGLLLVGVIGQLRDSNAPAPERSPVASIFNELKMESEDALRATSDQGKPHPEKPPQRTAALVFLFAVLPLCIVGFSALNPSLQALLSLGTSDSDQGGMLGLAQSLSALARIGGPIVGMSVFPLGAFYPYWTASALMVVVAFLVQRLAASQELDVESQT